MDFFSLDSEEFIREIDKQYPGLWDLAMDTNKFLVNFQLKVKANSQSLHEVIGVLLYIRCANTYQALLIMISKGMPIQAQILLRGLVETLFIIVAISKDREFARTYVEHEEHQRRGVLNKFKRYKESIDKADPDIKVADKILDEINQNIQIKNIQKLSTEEISKKAGLHDWYDTVYAIISTAVHASARTLEAHIEVGEDGQEIKSFVNMPIVENSDMYLGTGINFMHIVTDAICDILDLEHEQQMVELNKRYEDYHQKHG